MIYDVNSWGDFIYCLARGNTKSWLIAWENHLRLIKRLMDEEDELIKQHPNKRVVHLALYGHGRTRKKNRNRALRYLKKEKGNERT